MSTPVDEADLEAGRRALRQDIGREAVNGLRGVARALGQAVRDHLDSPASETTRAFAREVDKQTGGQLTLLGKLTLAEIERRLGRRPPQGR